MNGFKAICDEYVPIAAPVVIVEAETDRQPAHVRVADATKGETIAGIALDSGYPEQVISVVAVGGVVSSWRVSPPAYEQVRRVSIDDSRANDDLFTHLNELVERDRLEVELMAIFNYSELDARKVLLDEMKKGHDAQVAFDNIKERWAETGEKPSA
ncbi:MAG: hypothetical protein RIC84_08715 [Aggregatilineales bacterium]